MSNNVLSNVDFNALVLIYCMFLSFQNSQGSGSQMSLSEFISRPVHHFQDLCGILTAILDATPSRSQEREVFFAVVQGKLYFFVISSSWTTGEIAKFCVPGGFSWRSSVFRPNEWNNLEGL